jgi:hypothetical protein
MATSGARTAVLRVAWRVVRAVEFLLVAALTIYYGFLNLPSAAAAAYSALRVAASLTVQWYMFIAANAIVMVLLALFLRRDDDASSSSDAPLFSRLWPSDDVDAQDRHLPSQGPTLMLPSPGAPLMLPPPPVATDTEAVEEDKEKPVFVDKKAVHVTMVRAQAPRRSMSEKTTAAATGGGGGAILRRREATPELRRVESENGRQRQPEASPAELGTDDEEAFRRYIDAYISKQQARFQCEESAAAAAASGKGGGGGAVVSRAVVAVK